MQKERHKNGRKFARKNAQRLQKICQVERQKQCQKMCQVERQKICQKFSRVKTPKRMLEVCQKICSQESQYAKKYRKILRAG